MYCLTMSSHLFLSPKTQYSDIIWSSTIASLSYLQQSCLRVGFNWRPYYGRIGCKREHILSVSSCLGLILHLIIVMAPLFRLFGWDLVTGHIYGLLDLDQVHHHEISVAKCSLSLWRPLSMDSQQHISWYIGEHYALYVFGKANYLHRRELLSCQRKQIFLIWW